MVFTTEMLIGSLKRIAEKVKDGGKVGDIDKDYIIVKLTGLVLEGKLTEAEAQQVSDVLGV